MTQLSLGSLFDGIGGFPLAGIYAGIKPVWASEIEPFPIRVTTKRLPGMQHLGDIHRLNGGELEPVNVITFGSPCQNLSIAGKRTGLAGEQSSLFFEAVRVITEMREKTNGAYPRWVVWENVPGALSSAGGDDFRIVLESLLRIKDSKATVPMPPNGKWLSAGEIMGSDYSLAWRILDASKGWGVAQRRRRIFVVVNLNGTSAGKVLFESEGMSGYTPPRGQAREGIAGGAETGAGASGSEGTAVAVEFNPTDSRIKLKEDGICQTLTSRMGTGGNTVPLTLKIRSGCEGGGKGAIWQENRSATLGCNNDQTLFVPKAYGISSDQSNAMLSDNPHSGVYEADTSRTLDCSGGNPVCNQGGIAIVEPLPSPECLNPWDSQTIRQYDANGVFPALTANTGGGQNRQGIVIRNCSGSTPTLNQKETAAVQPIAFTQNQRDEVRDLQNVSGTLSANPGMKQQTYVAAFMGGQGAKAGGLGYREEQSPTLKSVPSGGNTVPDIVYALQGSMIGRKDENGPQGDGVNKNVCFTLNTIDRPAVACPEAHLASGKPQAGTLTARAAAQKAFLGNQEAFSGDYYVLEPGKNHVKDVADTPSYCMTVGCYGHVAEEKSPTLEARGFKDPPVVGNLPDTGIGYVVRRLTPGECCRLQGYLDGWTENLGTEKPTDAELHWWAGVFEDWYRAQGKSAKPPSKARLLKWLKDPRTDAAEYKAYGNSVAVPCVFFVLAGIVWAAEKEG